jgi:hypothetical protein
MKLQIEVPGSDFQPFWKPEMTHEDYHADKTAVGNSNLKTILKSGQSFVSAMTTVKEQTEPMRFGTLAHMAILEGQKFLDRYIVMPEFWGFTQKGEKTNNANCKEVKDAKARWEMEQAPGAVIVTQEERDDLIGMIESVIKHPDAFNILKDGQTEISGYYADPVTGIKCKIRPDFLSLNLGVLADVKTTTDCSIEEFSKTIWNLRYDFQMGQYCEGSSIISKKKIEFGTFIVVEKKPPYEVAVYIADDLCMEIGQLDYRRALDQLKFEMESGWQRYQMGMQNISLPFYAVQKYQIGGV